MKRGIWKLSDTVAAVFFGVLFFSMLFRPFFGGLDVVVFIVAGVWGLSVWARATHGEYAPSPLTAEQKTELVQLDERRQEMSLDPAYKSFAGNVWHNHEN